MAEIDKAQYDYLAEKSHKHDEDIRQLMTASASSKQVIDGLSSQLTKEFSQIRDDMKSVRDDVNANKRKDPNLIGLGTFCISVLIIFGSYISYMNNQVTSAMMRESDLRFQFVETTEAVSSKAIVGAIQEITGAMRADDAREQSDAATMADLLARLDYAIEDIDQLDEEHSDFRRIKEKEFTKMYGRVQALEQALNINNGVFK